MPYRRTDKVEARLARARERLLRTARQLIAEGGFRAAQVAEIAAEAEVGIGTIYRHFPSKAKLFAEVVSTVSRREVDVVVRIAEADGPASQRLADAIGAFASRALRGRGLAHAMIVEPVDPEVDEARLTHRRALGKALEAILTDGVESGEFPAQDVSVTAACLVGALLEGLIGPLAPTALHLDDDRARLIDSIVACCLRAASGKEPARLHYHCRTMGFSTL